MNKYRRVILIWSLSIDYLNNTVHIVSNLMNLSNCKVPKIHPEMTDWLVQNFSTYFYFAN